MALFDVPGWSIKADPTPDFTKQISKKRKRPSSADTGRYHTAEVNLDRLVKKLKGSVAADPDRTSKALSSSKGKGAAEKMLKKQKKTLMGPTVTKTAISRPKPLKRTEKDTTSSSPRPTKKAKVKHSAEEHSQDPSILSTDGKGLATAGLTALQKNMKQSLDGARFRLINETLYKSDSREAHQMMLTDPHIYQEYHTGFRHQVQSWPTNPVEHYISMLSSYPPKTVIADLGCGDAALARALIPNGMTVLSFDLVSDGAYVVEADTCGRLPLPGSEGSETDGWVGEAHIVDVVVCALSLMGTNWPHCLREAWRILKPNGELKIAEVASRFTDMEAFQSLVGTIGFKKKSKDDSNSHFTLFEFRKIARKAKSEKEWSKIAEKGTLLKACEYKRR